ncbi:Gfo/Idh/MocA family oxidoreductase [Desulfuromonas acetoxidans]|uniref:Dehydrogenase n=1 Tax=Desulfuromonas acetoxidans (strain DSM 684 / 11070) TaxID=281689 RepID=Q1K175_DESA6|nr:Gfo/Idh/MocA family oxidoreductase [Desulfuromonas acetoxidans]EAT16133.1 dehydrogenase [Desulfuromonas acetoxidans DSM 684]MBF0646439.1 Gfo/Idh/MocA family oxidoreductase [Desulfuromonas acetoxidans]NVD25514.1 Gfo/Idh/MocA family oxidoreductase [Desulfuromonas acetoxidans]NVE17536.1 Gfo/Idh/MocA family oxidoreductase [Desulfuromonas acetoxidans]
MMEKVLLVGAGSMAKEYAKILEALNVEFDVVGRSEMGVKSFVDTTGYTAFSGGLESFIQKKTIKEYTHFVVATNVVSLYHNVSNLLKCGAEKILVEKPCVLNEGQLDTLFQLTSERKANVYIAYNRRFFSSVLKAKEIVEEDGGLEMVKFDFTEWAHVIEGLEKDPLEKERWLLSNSTHVIDLALYFAGKPEELSAYVAGSLDWHPAGKVFTGAGKSENGVLFSYGSDWGSAGRWWLELFTAKRKLRLCPMEKLLETRKGTVVESEVSIEDDLDREFKPGLYLQLQAFLKAGDSDLKNIAQLRDDFAFFCNIAGY